jgi:cytochrome c553
MQARTRSIRRTVYRVLIALIWLGSGAFLFAWSGVYNVAASSGHWGVVDAFLRFGMRHSVSLRAGGIEEPDLSSWDLIALGAGHFERGCAFCHGSPDKPGSPVAGAMLPAPPSLATPLHPWTDQELFWIVRHGIKYTGMPAWPTRERADEVWAMVAFLRKLSDIDAVEYRALTVPKGDTQKGPSEVPRAALVRNCATCHGDREAGPESALVPRLHRQRERFLANALDQYAKGTRPSGIMQTVALGLNGRDMQLIAKYYAGLPSISAPPSANKDETSELGRKLATEGDPARRIPACISCHGPQKHETFPTLDGQSAAYLAGQLRLWKAGHNTVTDGAAIMAPIAVRLNERDIEALARYFSGNSAHEAAEMRP